MSPNDAAGIADAARRLNRPLRIMEVCGTHTHAIGKAGLRALLPDTLELISGPGCPVCVTSQRDIERAIALSGQPEVTVCTFGDMLRVPGHTSSLERERARGADIRIVYSPTDALEMARSHPDRKVIFLGIGFETTAPAVASAILSAHADNLENFWCLVLHKRVVPVMEAVLSEPVHLDGFLTPGHVAVILGPEVFAPLAQHYRTPCVATGFAPADILEGIAMALHLVEEGSAVSAVQYTRAVRNGGNRRAQEIMDSVFETAPADWRGLGRIPASGLQLSADYQRFDASRCFDLPDVPDVPLPECQCGRVLRGLIAPMQCPQFGKRCTPRSPLGPCMVSSEGSCAARYRYG